jgi:hypothetical protein
LKWSRRHEKAFLVIPLNRVSSSDEELDAASGGYCITDPNQCLC